MSDDRELPKGWVKTSLAAVGRLYCGQSPSVSEVNHSGQGAPYVTGPDQWDGSTLTVDKWTTNPRRLVPDGCIFITVKGAGVGTLFAGVACAIGRDVYAYEPAKELPRKFIEYSLRYNILQILRHAKGDIPGLSKDHILGHQASFPPLNEQQRIVAKIEELFSDLDAGVAALERAKANLKRYRAAVLKAAVEGKLTEEWRAEHPATEPAPKLLERILKERRQKWEADQLAKYAAAKKEPPKNWKEKYVEPTPPVTNGLPELPEEWCWASVEQLLFESPQNGAYFPKTAYGKGNAIIRIDDYQLYSSRSVDQLKKVNISDADYQTYSLSNNDLLVNRVNSLTHLGKVLLIESRHLPAVFESNMMRLKLGNIKTAYYVREYLRSKSGIKRLTQNAKWAVNQASINQMDVQMTPVPLPPIEEQQAIVNEVAERLSQIDLAESTINQGLLRATRLRQSILKQAFEGKLVPQDPNDEPADELLKRIKSESEVANDVRDLETKPRKTNVTRQRAT